MHLAHVRARSARLALPLAAVLLATGLVAAASAPAGAVEPEPAAAPAVSVVDGVTQPVFGYDDAVRERVFVTTDVDSDSDGALDVVALDVMRPAATEEGLLAPVVMDASPYYTTVGRGNEAETKRDLDGDGVLDVWPLFYDNYFVPRGYAVVLLDMVGTGQQHGLPDHGRHPGQRVRGRRRSTGSTVAARAATPPATWSRRTGTTAARA